MSWGIVFVVFGSLGGREVLRFEFTRVVVGVSIAKGRYSRRKRLG